PRRKARRRLSASVSPTRSAASRYSWPRKPAPSCAANASSPTAVSSAPGPSDSCRRAGLQARSCGQMTALVSVQAAIEELARDPLRNIVLLKQLLAYPEHVKVLGIRGSRGAATLVALDASVIPYDRETYPKADVVAFLSSDHPELTALLALDVPRDVGIVFKLSREADVAPIASRFPISQRTAFVSFTT